MNTPDHPREHYEALRHQDESPRTRSERQRDEYESDRYGRGLFDDEEEIEEDED